MTPFPTMTPPPEAPSRSDPPETFITKADAFIAWQILFREEVAQFMDYDESVFVTRDGLGYVSTGGNVGMGTRAATAAYVLDMGRATGGTAQARLINTGTAAADNVIFYLTTSAMANATTCTIAFGDGDNASIGLIQYVHSDDSLRFRTAGADVARFTSTGRFGLGITGPTCTLDVGGGIKTSRTGVTAPAATDGNVFSGTYTPTLTNVTNVAAAVPSVAQYMRVGNVVTVSGRLQVDPTAGGLFDLSMSLPIASAMTDASQISGTAAALDPSENAGGAGAIYGDPANDVAVLRRTTVLSGNATYSYHFTYQVL